MKRNVGSLTVVGSLTGASLILAAAALVAAENGDQDWKSKLIAPVANPLFFEPPQITSEVRPVFMHHGLNDTLELGGAEVPLGGAVRVYAVQVRYAITDRLAIIATKDGYIEFRPDNTLAHESGWADIGAGLKYALIDDTEAEFLLTAGVKIEVPTGSRDVFQGNGAGEWDLFLSAVKGWGNFHAMGSIGGRIPNDFSEETAQLHYSLQLDYYACRWFIPFAVANAYTVLTDSDQLPLGSEGYDLINFGATRAGGETQVAVGGGFRSRILENLDLGFAYEVGVTHSDGIFDDRFTVDAILRF